MNNNFIEENFKAVLIIIFLLFTTYIIFETPPKKNKKKKTITRLQNYIFENPNKTKLLLQDSNLL